MLSKLLELGHKAVLWFSDPTNRKRLRGARIEVIPIFVCRTPEPSVLLVKSGFHETWMPPQEGVLLSETLTEALYRCLKVELGLDIPDSETERARRFYIRSISYLGDVELQPERWGERLVADDATGTAFESVKLKRKAYWLATIILGSSDDIIAKPDGREVVAARWFPIGEAAEKIRTTNHAAKAALLIRGLDIARNHLTGASRRPTPNGNS